MDALPNTTVVRQETNTGPLACKTHTLPIAPRPLQEGITRVPYKIDCFVNKLVTIMVVKAHSTFSDLSLTV